MTLTAHYMLLGCRVGAKSNNNFVCVCFTFTGGPGLHDPCEKEPTDTLANMTDQQAEAVTYSAQVHTHTRTHNAA